VKRLTLLLLAGCAPHATEIIVTVSNADLVVHDDFDRIHIEARAAGAILSQADVTPCGPNDHGGCQKFPFTVLLVPGERVDVPAWVSLQALASDTPVIDDALVLKFARGQTLRYEVVLSRICKQSHCAGQGEVCNQQGTCSPIQGPSADAGPSGDAGNTDAGTADAGSIDAGDAGGIDAGDAGSIGARRIFLTRGATFGNFGGLAGGNLICAQDAMMAGLTGNFVAILGSSTKSPNSYLVLDGGSRPIVRLDGQQVATDATFWEANHMNPINVGPDGKPVAASGNLSQNAWTGFNYTGATIANGTCADWTSVPTGYIGDPYGVAPASIVGAWADYAAQGNCTSNYPCHLYCIEQ
jgi:hypothetical protein